MIEFGMDADASGVLDDGEVNSAATQYVCNGDAGMTPLLDAVQNALACSGDGGVDFSAGFDTDGDGTLQASEATTTATICNGAAGLQSLVVATTEPADAGCGAGIAGVKLDVGVDTDGNGNLDAGEIVNTEYACNGADGAVGAAGADGADGANAVATTTAAGPGCTMLDVFTDLNANSMFDAGEPTTSATICNGANGANGADGAPGAPGAPGATGATGAPGANAVATTTSTTMPCTGVVLDVFTDLNANSMLDAGEPTTSATICNGVDGMTGAAGAAGPAGPAGPPGPAGPAGTTGLESLVVQTTIPLMDARCTSLNGGFYVETGVDDNANGVLDMTEVDQTSPDICNP